VSEQRSSKHFVEVYFFLTVCRSEETAETTCRAQAACAVRLPRKTPGNGCRPSQRMVFTPVWNAVCCGA